MFLKEKIMNMKKVFCLIVLFALIVPHGLFAQPPAESADIGPSSVHCGVCEAAESRNFGKSAPGKIGRGLVNTGLGWTNLLAQPIQAGSSGGNVFTGIGKGLWMTVVRTVQGVVEIGLFWLPPGPGEDALKHCALGDMGITGR